MSMVLKTIWLILMAVGALANVILFFHNVSPVLLGHRLRPPHMIAAHMTVANSLVLLVTGIPHTMLVFGFRNPMTSLRCKVVYYIHRMAHSVSLCSTCVLSTYQALTLTLLKAAWLVVPGRTSMATGYSCCTCWMLSALMNTYIIMRISGPRGTHNDTHAYDQWFCSSFSPSVGVVAMLSTMDAVFISLMVWTCGSMLLLLKRHQQRLHHIHTSCHSHKGVPERTATHTILMLVLTFVVFYALHSIFVFYVSTIEHLHLYLIHIIHILGSGFPTVSPLLLILRDPRAPRLCS